MPRCRLLLFLSAATIAACTAVTPTEPVRGHATEATAANEAATADSEPADSWKASMKQVGRNLKLIDRTLTGTAIGKLDEVSRAASDAAALLHDGYGRFEDKRVPGFARYARETESWLLRISLEARQDHSDLAKDLYLSGKEQYCGKCHEAAKPIYGW